MSRGLFCLAGAGWLVAAALLPGCGGAAPTAAPPPEPPAAQAPLAPTAGVPWFEDATAAAGVSFTHFDSATAMHYLPEVMGSGVGWIDYDGDGWPDLFCVQAGPIRPAEHRGPLPTHKLYRNNRDGTFTDVTDRVGLNKSGYGMGVAVGDYDNDGFDDLVVTYLGGIALFHNVADPRAPGGRRFEDATAASKLANPHWGTSCGWADIDGDGRLDLYVCNYVRIDLDDYKTCFNSDVNQVYACPPTVFPTVAHKLFRNNGDGTFADVTAASGIAGTQKGAGLGVVLVDLDGDGKIDIYVANDMGPAHVYQNQGGGKFAERGAYSGAALMAGGRFMAGMGVAAGDLDGTGRPSLLVANYQNEPTMVFLNAGKLTFRDWTHPSGLGPATTRTLGFGIELFDADLDGNLDVALANGHVVRNSAAIFKAPYEQEAQLLVGDGKGHFREVSDKAGAYFREKFVGRGLAACDYNNDGLPDLAFANNAGPLKLLRNATRTPNHWVRLDLVGNGTTSNRSAIGARVEVEAAGRKLVRFVHGGGSYLSAGDRRLVVGLGAAEKAERVTVVWPDGTREEFRDLAAGRGWRHTQGKGAAEPAATAPPG
jgi:hypothetical protein